MHTCVCRFPYGIIKALVHLINFFVTRLVRLIKGRQVVTLKLAVVLLGSHWSPSHWGIQMDWKRGLRLFTSKKRRWSFLSQSPFILVESSALCSPTWAIINWLVYWVSFRWKLRQMLCLIKLLLQLFNKLLSLLLWKLIKHINNLISILLSSLALLIKNLADQVSGVACFFVDCLL